MLSQMTLQVHVDLWCSKQRENLSSFGNNHYLGTFRFSWLYLLLFMTVSPCWKDKGIEKHWKAAFVLILHLWLFSIIHNQYTLSP